jgi:pimeloyl-ACP methyl ester carboxylesterase
MRAWLRGLPPRRRVFVAGIALLVVAAASVAAITAGAHLISEPPAPVGFPPQYRPGPVLLVPGYGGSPASLDRLAQAIRATGRTATVVRLPGNGTGDLSQDAAVLNTAVSQALGNGAPSVDIIGYSAGGVVALLWAREDDGRFKARRIVTLGSPFHGTVVAGTAAGFAPGACPVACQQLVPGSSLLAGLAAGVPPGLPWMSLWTTGDATVTPPDSARLAGAINVPIQSVCPGRQISHAQLPTNLTVIAMVTGAISAGLMLPPAPAAVC